MGLVTLYAYVILMGIVIISLLILFIWRLNKVGNIITSARASLAFTWLILGIFMLTLGFYKIYSDLNNSKLIIYLLFIWIYLVMSGVISLIIFLTSNVFIGLKGISFISQPFYIPVSELLSYTFKGSRLILKRNFKSEYEILTISISIKASDIKKVVEGLDHLSIKRL